MRTTFGSYLGAALVAGCLLTAADGQAGEVTAGAVIDWDTLDIRVLGEGGLVPTDVTLIHNAAWTSGADFATNSASQQWLLPAFASAPFEPATTATGLVNDEGSAALATAGTGTAGAASETQLWFETSGTGTAIITVGYGLSATADPGVAAEAAAIAEARLEGMLVSLDSGARGNGFSDAASVLALADPDVNERSGALSLSFDFDAGLEQLFVLSGVVEAFALGLTADSLASALPFDPQAALAADIAPVPLPAGAPLLLSALAGLGLFGRRRGG